MTWDTKPTDFTTIGETKVLGNELDSYVDGTTDWVKEQIEAQQSLVTLQLKMNDTDATGLLYFYSSEADDTRNRNCSYHRTTHRPIPEMIKSNIEVYTRPVEKRTRHKGDRRELPCFVLLVMRTNPVLQNDRNDETIQLPANASGVYLCSTAQRDSIILAK